jgi:hypothetical protein
MSAAALIALDEVIRIPAAGDRHEAFKTWAGAWIEGVGAAARIPENVLAFNVGAEEQLQAYSRAQAVGAIAAQLAERPGCLVTEQLRGAREGDKVVFVTVLRSEARGAEPVLEQPAPPPEPPKLVVP